MLQRVAKDPKMLEAFPLVMQNPFVQTLKTNYASLQLNITELLTGTVSSIPPSILEEAQKEAQLNALQGTVNQGVQQIRQSIEMQSQLAGAMDEYVQKLLDETKREVFAFTQKVIQYGVLQREVQAQTEVYNLLLKRLHETGGGPTDPPAMLSGRSCRGPDRASQTQKNHEHSTWPAGRIRVGLCIAWGLTALDTAIHTPMTWSWIWASPSSEPSRGSASHRRSGDGWN